MSHKTASIVSGLAASVAAFGITSGLISAKDAAIASLFAVPGALITYVISDSKAQKRVRELDSKLSKALRDLDSANTKTTFLGELEGRNSYLQTELNKTREALEVATEQHRKAFDLSNHMKHTLMLLEGQVSTSSSDIEALQAEVEEWESEFSNRVTVESDRLFQIAKKAEIDKIFAEHDKITSEAMSITEAFQKWGMKVSQRFQDKNAAIEDTKAAYQQNIREFTTLVTKERDCYLDQIDLLNQRIAQLQHELAGDLIEVEYLPVAYSVEGRIANDIAKEVFSCLQIPLTVKGYNVKPDGSTDVAYGYSRSMGSTALVEVLKRQSEAIAKSLRIHKITSIRKLEIADLIVVSFRREPAVKEDELKRLFTPIEKLAIQVIREMSRKGTVRIMGATGDGKGICARYLVSRLIQLEEWYIRLHDPQDGSAQDYWGIPKVSKSGTELKQALKKISGQMLDRESTKVHYPVTLDILDEIDTQLEKDDKGQFLNLISRVRHLGMKMILIGQNPKVSRAGFQWADMEQMIAFYQGSSALDAIKNNPALELKKDILLRQYEEISSVLQAKNEWLDDAKKHYFGLCVIPGKSPQWYELPIADEVEIDITNKLLCETFAVTNTNLGFKGDRNFPNLTSKSANINTISRSHGEAESFTQKGLASIPATPDYGDATATTAKPAISGKATCKKHPGSELRLYKDGRGYCTSCKKKLPKSDVEYL